MWTQVIRSFAANHRLWAVQFELLGFLDRKPDMKAAFAQANAAAQWLVAPDSLPTGAQLCEAVRTIAAVVA